MRALLDSSAIIFSFEYPNSNSRLVFDLVQEGKLSGVVSEKALAEVKRVFSLRKNERFLFLLEKIIRKNFEVVPRSEIGREIKYWRGKIKEKDLEHLATAKNRKVKYIIALDRDFEKFAEYHTPKKFVEKALKIRGFETEY
ncbi:PIN domain-containing protein [Candidatus Micrarchaeota archaeon]|nr:PIN domain-containing protein [Candidatus Micrarchaeota archaeon]